MIRTRDNLRRGVMLHKYVEPSGATQVQNVTSQTPCIGSYKWTSTVPTTNFQQGKLSLNACEIWEGTGSCTEGHFEFRWPSTAETGTYKKIVSGQFASFRQSITSGSQDPQLLSFSRAKADAKLNEAATDVGMMLAELGETLGMLAPLFRGLTNYLKKVGKSSKRTVPKGTLSGTADKLGNAWLQYRLGIIPFICDIEAIMEEYAKKVHMFNKHIRSRRATVQKESSSQTVILDSIGGGVTYEAKTVDTIDVQSTSIAYFEMTLDGIAPYLSYWGVSPTQLPSLAWELVPYSFVVDWFFNVGDWLSAISPSLFTRVTGRCTSQVIKTTRKVTTSSPALYGWALVKTSGSTYNWSTRKLIRSVDTSTSAMPTFNPNWYKLERLVDSLALLWGAFRRS